MLFFHLAHFWHVATASPGLTYSCSVLLLSFPLPLIHDLEANIVGFSSLAAKYEVYGLQMGVSFKKASLVQVCLFLSLM